ncbi:MAG: dTDP-4-amino-4,6-dideoxygalactose transaminase [Lachnospiraceae bacterium]|nr:dTDP-4-amino-4,6-dideoxygalactose transaminase [Lachnospiraceae bacterium]
MIDFNRPPYVGTELDYIRQSIESGKLCGDGAFTKKCSAWFQEKLGVRHTLLTTSCTHALEMASYLCDLKEGDEVIMPSYTFVSTADAFVLRGARIVFVDIRPDTMNMDENRIEAAITEKTKVIAPVHYAGVGCEMDQIMALARKYGLKVVEDAAQGVYAWYKGKALGTIGDFGCFSFHETKNYSMGEGGALLFNEERYLEPAEILREKGTDRSKFFRGQIDKYTWVGYGSSYLPSDMNAAYLYAGLLAADRINEKRHQIWNYYDEHLRVLKEAGYIEQPFVPDYVQHNAHMYYIKVRDLEVRSALIAYLREKGICSVFHYIPLHSATAGLKFGRFSGEDVYTTRESERLLRLPMFYNLSMEDTAYVTQCILDFPGFNR